MTRWCLLLVALLSFTPAKAMISAPPAAAPQWLIKVDATIAGTHLSYRTAAWVYSPGPDYRLKLYAVGPYFTGPIANHATDLAQIIAEEPRAAVFNGGYWDNYPFIPAGLFVQNGQTQHGFDFAKTPGGDFGQSAVVCLSKDGQFTLRQTRDYASSIAQIKQDCFSSLQAGPFVVEKGESGIRQLHERDFSIRTILGTTSAHIPTLIIFQQPVHLLVAAEFLRTKGNTTRNVVIGNKSGGSGLQSSGGLGLLDAVNLNGAAGVVCFFEGHRVAGYSTLALPSAFSLQPK